MQFYSNHRFVSAAVGFALALSLFGSAAYAQAATLAPAQIDAITSLLQAFGVDSGTIANVQAVLNGQTITAQIPASPSSNETASSTESSQSQNGGNCALLSGNLQIGTTDQSTNGEVSRLQSFLGKDNSIYPEDLVTGYFGSSTLQAVQRWQAAHGIVSSGDSMSTGYGIVGPRTRGELNKEIEHECEQGDQQNSQDNTASSTQQDQRSGSGDN